MDKALRTRSISLSAEYGSGRSGNRTAVFLGSPGVNFLPNKHSARRVFDLVCTASLRTMGPFCTSETDA
jgi:hypothetical protein